MISPAVFDEQHTIGTLNFFSILNAGLAASKE
jgi:hypothetical protein